jgi:hypothetical protein
MNSNIALNLFDQQAVLAELNRLCSAEEWDKVQALSKAYESAKQRHELISAEVAYLATLTPEKRAQMASRPVNFGMTIEQIEKIAPLPVCFVG